MALGFGGVEAGSSPGVSGSALDTISALCSRYPILEARAANSCANRALVGLSGPGRERPPFCLFPAGKGSPRARLLIMLVTVCKAVSACAMAGSMLPLNCVGACADEADVATCVWPAVHNPSRRQKEPRSMFGSASLTDRRRGYNVEQGTTRLWPHRK